MSDELTYHEILEAGEAGDARLNVKLTARQLCALELVLSTALDYGVGNVVLVGALAGYGEEFANRLRLEFARAQARVGIELNRALGNDEVVLEFAARLAELDGEVANLD